MKEYTIESAFHELDTTNKPGPIEAIDFLYNHERDRLITAKIAYSLRNAYNDDVYLNKLTGEYSYTPIWYAIVAENHLSEELISPIINLFTTTDQDMDVLNEQGQIIVTKLCDELGDVATSKVMDAIEKYTSYDNRYPLLFLFDCLAYAKDEKYLPQILRILEDDDNLGYIDSFAVELAHAEIKGALPRLKEIKKKYNDEDFRTIELDEAIKELETGIHPYPEYVPPRFKQVKHWKEEHKYLFKQKDEQVPNPISNRPTNKVKKVNPILAKKIGRNDPCPCGSGKKYKKCHLKK